jgi:AraC-like DNA-binding protein
VVFGEGDESQIVFDTRALRWRVALPAKPTEPVSADPERELMTFQLRDQTLLQAVRAVVTARLPQKPVKLDVCARILGVSPRTLQRRLDDGGVTFETLVDGLRRDLAIDGLRRGAMVTEVAMALGYSDTAHFTRAFRRWTGRTPTAFRDGAH